MWTIQRQKSQPVLYFLGALRLYTPENRELLIAYTAKFLIILYTVKELNINWNYLGT